jgi:hypothetical protein
LHRVDSREKEQKREGEKKQKKEEEKKDKESMKSVWM